MTDDSAYYRLLGKSRCKDARATVQANKRAIHAQLAQEVTERRKGRFQRIVEAIFRMADIGRAA